MNKMIVDAIASKVKYLAKDVQMLKSYKDADQLWKRRLNLGGGGSSRSTLEFVRLGQFNTAATGIGLTGTWSGFRGTTDTLNYYLAWNTSESETVIPGGAIWAFTNNNPDKRQSQYAFDVERR